jgi:16S rRNA U516 pseudouridylate synthase RsuA-like enzyme
MAGADKGGETAKGATSERIARRIARAGICSRRDAEKLIIAGRVVVNGIAITSPALNVGPKDVIAIDGTPLCLSAAAKRSEERRVGKECGS